MTNKIRMAVPMAVSAVALFSMPGVHAQADADTKMFDEIVVTGSRLPASIESLPGSVTLIGSEELGNQLKVTSDLEAVLGQLVPGMGTSSASPANFTTSLRGRKPVFFVDGVPITPTLNDVGRELRLIDPAIIGRIEVVRGASALFGAGAGAGFINYITKPGERGENNFVTEVGTQFSLTDVGHGFRPSIRQSISGGSERFDYIVAGYYEKVGGFFDADGDRIAPIPNGFNGLADSDIYSFYAKFGYELADEQRIEASINKYRQAQDTDYTLLAGDVSEGIKATAVLKDETDFEEADQSQSNLVATLRYTHGDVFGSNFSLQGYYQESYNVFGYSANRFVLTDKPSGQSDTSSEKKGLRMDFRTPLAFLSERSELLWGADYLNDNTLATLVDGRTFAPDQELDSVAVFAQAFLPIGDFTLTAGIRHESVDLTIKDFTSLFTLSEITGGTLEYSATPINIGLSYEVADGINLFGAYSQGFEVASVGRVLRDYPVDVNVQILNPQPNLIDNYEGGVRTNMGAVSTEFVVFYTTSSNGQAFRPDPNNPENNVLSTRTPDRVYGIEFSMNADISEKWRAGGTFTFIEGKEDRDSNGTYESIMTSRRIPPSKLTAYLERDIGESWNVRVQALYTGDRKKFPGSTNFYEGDVNSNLVIDFSASGKFGPGVLTVGLNNALNSDYYTHLSEIAQRDDRYSKAPGATGTVKYRIEY